jgi:hypothetical protein
MAAVLGAFVPDTAVRWRGLVTGEAARRMGVAPEAKTLVARLERVGAAVRDAEARAACGDDGAARWLANVRAAAYEADGAVDRCRVAARRRRAHDQQQSYHHQARSPLRFIWRATITALLQGRLQVHPLTQILSSWLAGSSSAAILLLRHGRVLWRHRG